MIECKLVGVEGNSFSGKTTLINKLSEDYLVPYIEEYDLYAGGGENFPVFPPQSYNDACKAIDFFLEIEKKRVETLYSLMSLDPDLIMVDRSFFSCIFFQWYVKKFCADIPNSYEYSIELALLGLEKGEIIFPNVLALIEPESEASFLKRIEKRGLVHIDFLNYYSTVTYTKNWYEMLIDLYGGSGFVLQTEDENIEGGALNLYNKISTVSFFDGNLSLEKLLTI